MSSPHRRLRRALDRQRRSAPSLIAFDPGAFTDPRDALRVAARAQGCTCEPDVVIAGDGRAIAKHDDWCALLRRMDRN